MESIGRQWEEIKMNLLFGRKEIVEERTSKETGYIMFVWETFSTLCW